MTTEIITAEKVQQLYKKHNNKTQFLAKFGTQRFHLVDADFLKTMYNYLIQKVK